jgi:predicted transcriptional regulator
LQSRTNLTSGSVDHHLRSLIQAELLERSQGTRNIRLTKTGIHALSHAGLIEAIAHEPVYALTAKGLHLLEVAPAETPV